MCLVLVPQPLRALETCSRMERRENSINHNGKTRRGIIFHPAPRNFLLKPTFASTEEEGLHKGRGEGGVVGGLAKNLAPR